MICDGGITPWIQEYVHVFLYFLEFSELVGLGYKYYIFVDQFSLFSGLLL